MTGFASVAQGNTAVTMPWGKHKGKPLDQVPPDYLRWAITNASIMSDELRAAIEQQLNLAVGSTRAPDAPPVAESDVKNIQAMLIQARIRIKDLEGQLKQARAAVVPATVKLTDSGEFRRILKQWFGAMSRQFHPDMGGTAEKQALVNILYRDLMRRVEEAGR